MPGLRHGVYAITDCAALDESRLMSRCTAILEGGIAAMQYRNKQDPWHTRCRQAREINELCRRYDTPLIVNDDIELARTVDAAGVHLGIDDMPLHVARRTLGREALIGASCYDSLARAVEAERLGADYVAFGAFFDTRTKIPRTRAGIELLRRGKTELHVPIVAIGGITPENAAELLAAGADNLAISGSLFRSEQPRLQVDRFNRLFQHSTRGQED